MPNITRITRADIEWLADAFATMNKDQDRFEAHYLDHLQGKRVVFIARDGEDGENEQVMGYVTLIWESQYTQFWRRRVPEIVDLNVVPGARRRGYGTALVRACEQAAYKAGYARIGISVVVDDPAYEAARQLYPKLGYEPDGFGVTAHDNELHLWKNL